MRASEESSGDDGVADAVEGRVGRGQQSVDIVAGFVVAFRPGHAGSFGVLGVELADLTASH